MYKYRKIIYVFMILALLFAGVATVIAYSLYEPTTTWNVTPVTKTFPGDRTCPAGTYLVQDKFISFTEGIGDGFLSGTYTIDGKEVTVNITVYADNSFDFTIENGLIQSLFVKGGKDSGYLLYQYDPKLLTGPDKPVSYDTGLHDGYISGEVYQDISHLDFCLIPKADPLIADKTAVATYDRTVTWKLTKSVDPTSHSGYAGETAGSSIWTVIAEKTEVLGNYQVNGSITVTNPNGFEVPFSISDQLNDGTVADVICPVTGDNTGTVPAYDNVECSYSAKPLNDDAMKNTAVVTSYNPRVDGATAEKEFTWKDVLIGYDKGTLSDPRFEYSELISGDTTKTFPETFVCTDDASKYVDGKYSFDVTNWAYLNDNIDLSASATVTVNCTLDPLVPTKTAEGSYDRTVTWELEKTVDPASHIGFAGEEAGSSTWTVKATKTEVSDNYKVVGTISVYNPAAIPQTFTVEDYLDDGSKATVDCPSLTVEAKATVNCTYTADATAKATENTVKVTAPGNSPQFAYKDFTFVENLIGYDSGNLIDKRFDFEKEISGTTTKTFPESFNCPSDPKLYEGDGVYSFKEENEATLNGNIGLKDSAEVNVTCYAPVVSKTANASYKETWTWTLEKSVDETLNSGYPGDKLDWVWKVTVGESFEDSDWKVTGMIYIMNPAPMPMKVALSDKLDDGTVASIEVCETPSKEDVFLGTVTVDPESTAVCYYTAEPLGKTAKINTATAELNSIKFSGEAAVDFKKTVINGTAKVTDTMIKLDESLIAGDGGKREWTKLYDHTCSTLKSAYGEDGTYSEKIDNTAYLTSDLQKLDSKATTEYICKAGFVDLLKHTNGMVDPTKDWKFELYLGPDGFGTTPIGTSSTLGDADGILDFGGPALRPDTTYTICELGVPAGYTTFWQINGSTVIPYNPNADDPTPEVLGNYCVDFIPTVVGETVHFYVDNQEGGGDPRTPGYWKNWNTCTGGGQAATADANGGWEDGFWLLDDVLNPAIGGGIIWDDILSDSFPTFPINSCELAVSILNTKDFSSGKVLASDPGYNLAKHLLAAQLNFGAGACKPAFNVLGDMDIDEVALAAETLLDKYDFDAVGEGISKKKKEDAALALQLATILDQYNNGMYCGSTYVP